LKPQLIIALGINKDNKVIPLLSNKTLAFYLF